MPSSDGSSAPSEAAAPQSGSRQKRRAATSFDVDSPARKNNRGSAAMDQPPDSIPAARWRYGCGMRGLRASLFAPRQWWAM